MKRLDWPMKGQLTDESLIGRKVIFGGYLSGLHRHWGYEVGEVYTIKVENGSIGPENIRGSVPSRNWGFEFYLITEGEVLACNYDYSVLDKVVKL